MGSLDVLSERVDPLVGSTLGKDYLVVEPIGRGGMAVVYLVEHQTLRKRFAAKVLSVELAANHEARARFNQEAHAAAHLDHENIVGISDFGETGDHRPFFVMELLRGQTLDQRVAEGAMSIEEVVAVAVPVARALAHAHAEGIIHRDVKPENVFLVLRSQGRFGVKVVDFGIAKTPVDTRLTKMGQTLGSPMFMSPEACRGDDVDPRADLYSFGVLLYLMLCGRVPFEDDNLLKVLQMQVSEPLPPPRAVNPALSPALAAVIERALAKDPDARYPSMDALLLDFEAAVPAGSNRLLIEAHTGAASSFRINAFTSSFASPFARDSQPLPSSQPLPRQTGAPLPATTSSAAMSVVPSLRPRFRARWLVALPVVGAAVFGIWHAMLGGAAPAAPPLGAEPPAVTVPATPTAPAPSPAGPTAAAASRDVPVEPPPAAAPAAAPPEPAAAAPAAAAPARPRVVLPPRPARTVKRLPPAVEHRAGSAPGSAATSAAGSAAGSAAPKGDPNLDIRLSR